MTYQDPTNIADASTSDTLADNGGVYTGQLQHFTDGTKDYLIVDGDGNQLVIYDMDPDSGALSNPQTLSLPVVAGNSEFGTSDEFDFYYDAGTNKWYGFDANNVGVQGLVYDPVAESWDIIFDQDNDATGVTQNLGGTGTFDTFVDGSGNLVGYAAESATQTFEKYTFNFSTQTWETTGQVYQGADFGGFNGDDNAQMEILTGPTGDVYMISRTTTASGSGLTNIYKIDPATGDFVPDSNVRITSVSYNNSWHDGEMVLDENGNIAIAADFGLSVIDPDTGAIITDFNDANFNPDGDLFDGGDGYWYYVSRAAAGDYDTVVFEVNADGTWTKVASGTDADSDLTWSPSNPGTVDVNTVAVTTSTGKTFLYSGQESGANSGVTMIAGTASTIGPGSSTICFAAGTLIEVRDGFMPVEDLSVGDEVRTKDNGYKPLKWIGIQTRSVLTNNFGENDRPVKISAGALGSGMPLDDLYVSPQHRILVK